MERIATWLLAAILAIIGIALLVGGAILIGHGGSPYYVIAALAVLGAAITLIRRRPAAIMIYGLFLAGTAAWSLWEVGFDAWALAPRVIAPAVLALCFLPGPIHRATGAASRWWIGGPILAICAVVAIAAVNLENGSTQAVTSAITPSQESTDTDWTNWGRTLSGTRYAPISQINTGNVTQLQPAWRFESHIPAGGVYSFEATPLAADGRLYVCLPHDVVAAVDEDTGAELWRFDAHTDFSKILSARCRGVSYYESPQPIPECQKRILVGTADARLVAIDAETGAACKSFGDNGVADLRIGMGSFPPGVAANGSPPAIVNGVAVVGQAVSDFMSLDAPSGVIRGYDAVTGALRWAWDSGHEDRTGLPPDGDTYTHDTPNSWPVSSGDEKLGLVFIPMGNSPPDYFGGYRTPESEKYASSVVALDVATGKVRWSFQTTHHDLWDYDIASQPVAVDLPGQDGGVPALIVSTKRGELFVLDRRDGHPIDPVVERPVPQGAAPGDRTAPTQPYTTGFPTAGSPVLSEADMWGLTPLDQLWCRIQFKEAHYDGQFTPPSEQPTIYYPGSAGGSNWGSVTVDTDRGLMVANTIHLANIGHLVPRAEADKSTAVMLPGGGFVYPMKQTPFAFAKAPFMSPLAVPCQRPPYGRLSVYDIASRKLLWSQPFGTAAQSGPFGIAAQLPLPMGVPNMGGSIATGGGLVFIGAAQDRLLRAYDIKTGRELWHAPLPAIGAATPMTYVSKKSGRQYVVIAAGGHFAIPGPFAGALVAFALPKQ